MNAQNVLVNPGAETGDLTGWQQSNTGYKYVVSTNQTIPGSSANFLAHSGKYTFQLFDTTADTSFIYQDYPAIEGSQWSASCYAICYASNYFTSGANAHMQIVFYDASNNVVLYPGTSGGVYGTVFLDPVDYSGLGVTWTIVPPMALDASGWMSLQATNLYDTDPATEASYDSTQLPAILTAPPGTAYVRYQIAFDNSATGGGDVYWDDCALTKLNFSDPDITSQPVAVTVYAGAPASFSVVASHTSAYPGEKLSYQWQYNGTNLPAAGGVNDISGTTTTPNLTFTNVQGADSGLYSVVVTVKSTAGNYTNSIRSVPVPLTVLVLSPLQKANVLGVNFGFENNPSWPLWEPFNGCYFVTADNTYGASTTPINILEGKKRGADRFPMGSGTTASITRFRPHPAPCGRPVVGPMSQVKMIFTAATRAGSRFGSRMPMETMLPALRLMKSFKIYGLGYTNADAQYTCIDTSSPNVGQTLYHQQLPRDQWVYLPVTNIVNNGGIGLADDLPYNTFPAVISRCRPMPTSPRLIFKCMSIARLPQTIRRPI